MSGGGGGGAIQILDLSQDDSKVKVLDENLKLLGKEVLASGAETISIVAVMGTYRTGKSFLLDLLMRFLNYRVKQEKAAAKNGDRQYHNGQDNEMSELNDFRGHAHRDWYLGKTDCPQPPWVKEAVDPHALSEGSDSKTGFIWKNGKEKCTQGVWVWSKPWVFDKGGEKVGVLLMDTQGAWDDSMSKDQSATIFGLTALVSSKLIYNIQNRIEEDKLENLDYFTTFAHRACSDMEGSPFGDLHLLIRDWVNFDDHYTLKQCKDQMEEHLQEFINVDKVPMDSRERVMRLGKTFKSIRCFGLDHPGKAVTRPKFQGEISAIEPDFLNLLDMFCEELFDKNFPQPSKPLGTAITATNFVQVVQNFAEAFRSSSGMAIGLREAFVKIDIMKARDDMVEQFRGLVAGLAPPTSVVDPEVLCHQLDTVKRKCLEEFSRRLRVFKPTEDTLAEYMVQFEQLLDQAAQPAIAYNREQVESATVKLVAAPAVAVAVWFVAVHHILLVVGGAVGFVVHMKKWVVKEKVEYCHPKTWAGMFDDAKRWSQQRWKDLQAIWIQLHRISPADVKETLLNVSTKVGAEAMAAANNLNQAAQSAQIPTNQGGITQPGPGSRPPTNSAYRPGR
mmetsp:Transcript_60776/g.144775  ORF Transcript_60776/g.144775 Transcript_60776/m.144775 type:complete len:617 (-) Transcript_60776:83-1933(-)|eukprot:CAMPEP_0178385098 /NCGR_PEP_ID=MMETSP0689_2-20121128/7860_1 /TAXON_ID=160604 /ORGANISM="Amphidinium massartii, Strain CS-259" /LENGTH=616 /DNA_ID=CAMNT_0020005375 /DNA_START=11 /DNA_END=1858 /DNA_ORIENTATION=+